MVDYISLVITSAFTGIGTAFGLALFELFLKERIHTISKRIKDVPKKISHTTMSKMSHNILSESNNNIISPITEV